MLITTVIPTYQRPHFLRRAMESVLNQTFQDFTLLICDNHSKDETFRVVSEYSKSDKRIVYVRRQENVGLVKNFIMAFEQVDTSYLSFLCDDDYLFPDFYAITLEGFKKYPEAGFSAGRSIIVTAKEKKVYRQFNRPALQGYFSPENGIAAFLSPTHMPPSLPGILFNRSKLHLIGGFDEQCGYAFDMELILRTASRFPYVATSRCVAANRWWSQAASSCSLDLKNALFHLNHITQHFSGNSESLMHALKALKRHHLQIIKNLWLKALLSNDVQTSREARIVFLKEGGELALWKSRLLQKAESDFLVRIILCFYVKARACYHLIRGFLTFCAWKKL